MAETDVSPVKRPLIPSGEEQGEMAVFADGGISVVLIITQLC